MGGVSTRQVNDLVQAMGLAGISKSTASKLCKNIDERVAERFCCNPERGYAGYWERGGSGHDPEQASNQGSLCWHVTTADGVELSLPDHRHCHCLVACQRPPGRA